MRAKIVFGGFTLFLVAAGATITAVDPDRLRPGGADARAPLADLTEGSSARPSGSGGDGPLAAFFATSRAIMAGDPGALFGHSSPSGAIAEAVGGAAAPPNARHVAIDGGGSGGMGDMVSSLVSQMSGLMGEGSVPTGPSDPAALEAMLDAAARLGAEIEIPLDSGMSETAPLPSLSATAPAPAPAPAKPVVVRRGGSSSEGLVQIGR